MFSIFFLAVAVICNDFDISTSLPRQDTAFYQIKSRINKKYNAKYDYAAHALAGINQLQTWYDFEDGLWDKAWWPSANIVTMMAGLQEYFPYHIRSLTDVIFPNTLEKTPKRFPDFINEFYDDELWWALAWIKVYDITQNETYLNTAADIFEDSKSVWGQTPCGGLWWDKNHTEVGAVVNELYLTTAAKLANRLLESPHPGYYMDEAMKAHNWFQESGLINGNNLINNALNLQTCKNDGNFVFTYNQGILLSGLAELTYGTKDQKYVNLANTIAVAAINAMTDSDGILRESCEPDACNGDQEQFKGIFSRNIQFLYKNNPNISAETATLFKNFLQNNAESIWAKDSVNNQMGLVWSGPKGKVSVQTQSSALDAIVGAAAMSLFVDVFIIPALPSVHIT
ncbi:putative glycosyl hydrolase family 76 [Golovinomyces cichoracearum]|uniref:Putative glycosyl hydrolase family 76 n=1 Tax=Golovinomyces cichoracearum TaxID=62708 RepID=A0A420J569_9PEZI|nr:putative glycosyl hydrolase family 76 [Golovinomyces cichoracearum]